MVVNVVVVMEQLSKLIGEYNKLICCEEVEDRIVVAKLENE